MSLTALNPNTSFYWPQRDNLEIVFATPWLNTAKVVASRALPVIGLLYQPLGRLISLTQTSATIADQAINQKSSNKRHWIMFKNGAEFMGTLVGLRVGLIVNSGLNLAQSIYALP